MKKYSKYIAAILVCATCMQLSACGISDIPGLSDVAGIADSADQNGSDIDSDTLSKAFSEKLDQGKEIIENSEEGISAFKDTAEDINEFADQATEFVSKMAEDTDAKGIIDKLKKATDSENKTGDTDNSSNSEADSKTTDDSSNSATDSSGESAGLLTSTADINLTSADGGTKNYTFVYDGETYKAKHTADHWTIYDSYKINSKSDMMIICQALIDLYPVHGSDMVSYRTAEDMTFEWQQHNIGYIFLGEKSEWASHLKDVDFDPADQGKTFDEIYKDRTGKEFKFSDFLSD
ncbi:MAG: hypothetical protein E7306_00750 [Butyrivibrio sp.]|nr:hypothetical protein [Butyrivibrio sp.]